MSSPNSTDEAADAPGTPRAPASASAGQSSQARSFPINAAFLEALQQLLRMRSSVHPLPTSMSAPHVVMSQTQALQPAGQIQGSLVPRTAEPLAMALLLAPRSQIQGSPSVPMNLQVQGSLYQLLQEIVRENRIKDQIIQILLSQQQELPVYRSNNLVELLTRSLSANSRQPTGPMAATDRLVTASLESRQQTVAPNISNSLSQMAPPSNALLRITAPGDLSSNAGASNHVAAASSTASPSQIHRSGIGSSTSPTMAAPGGSTAPAATSVSGSSRSSGPQDDRWLFPNKTNEERWAMRFEELKRFKQVRKCTSFLRLGQGLFLSGIISRLQNA